MSYWTARTPTTFPQSQPNRHGSARKSDTDSGEYWRV